MSSPNSPIAYGTSGYRSLKGLVLGLNTVSTLCGVTLVGSGMFGFLSDKLYGYPKLIPAISIGAGLILFLISFIGCFGTLFENKRLLHSYFTCFMVLALFQAFNLVVALMKGIDVDKVLNDLWEDAYTNAPRLINHMQYKLKCCGLNDVLDRALPNYGNDTCPSSPLYGYSVSCYSVLADSYIKYFKTFNFVLAVLILLQGIILSFTWILADKIPRKEKRYGVYHEKFQIIVNNGSLSHSFYDSL